MSLFVDILAATLLVAGALFTLVAALGVLRMEDVYVRMHASTKAATLGLMLIVVSLVLTVDTASIMEKGIALFLLVLSTAPVSAHLVGRAVWRVMEAAPAADAEDPDPREGGGEEVSPRGVGS